LTILSIWYGWNPFFQALSIGTPNMVIECI